MFSENLRQICSEKRISYEELAGRLGISRQAVSKWTNGTALPDIENLIVLSRILQVSTDSLLKEKTPCESIAHAENTNDKKRLIDFILEAGRKTYAGKGKESDTPSRPLSHDLYYAENEFLYIDSFVGGERFSGEEVIYESDMPVWSMNYTGRILSESFSGDFLKAALLLRPENKPFRGPELYRDGDYIYHSAVDGDFEWFQGSEEIYLRDEKVYECFYHGGIVK